MTESDKVPLSWSSYSSDENTCIRIPDWEKYSEADKSRKMGQRMIRE
jgi:hypothetical protein